MAVSTLANRLVSIIHKLSHGEIPNYEKMYIKPN